MHNISKTKELIVCLFVRKEVKAHTPVYISGADVEQETDLGCLVHIYHKDITQIPIMFSQ